MDIGCHTTLDSCGESQARRWAREALPPATDQTTAVGAGVCLESVGPVGGTPLTRPRRKSCKCCRRRNKHYRRRPTRLLQWAQAFVSNLSVPSSCLPARCLGPSSCLPALSHELLRLK